MSDIDLLSLCLDGLSDQPPGDCTLASRDAESRTADASAEPGYHRRHQEELEWHRQSIELGNLLAIPAALFVCARRGITTPPWLVRYASGFLVALLKGDLSTPRGRSNGMIDRRRQDNIDSARHDLVLEIRERRPQLAEDRRELDHLKGPMAERRRREIDRVLRFLGKGDLDTFECASRFLADTPARGSAAAIKRSFHKVEKNLRSDRTKARYYYMDWEFERLIGTWIDTFGLANPAIFDT